MKPLRILIVDDHDIVRLGLTTLLSRYPHFEVVAQASNAQQAIRNALVLKPDAIVMDVGLPGKSGIQATREITQKMPGMNVLILTEYSDEQQLFDAICAGAYGYILKQVASDELIHALEAVGRGEGWIDPKLGHSLFKHVREAMWQFDAQVFAPLSRQELRILALLSKGKNNKYIAHTLHLSLGTVRNYVTSLMGKLRLSSRVQACLFALEHHIDEHVPMPAASILT